MDIRPLIHMWLNRPDSYDDTSTQQVLTVKKNIYDMEADSPYVNLIYGDPYDVVDLWLDLDKFISRLDGCDTLALYHYLTAIKDSDPDNYETWLPVPEHLVNAFKPFVESM